MSYVASENWHPIGIEALENAADQAVRLNENLLVIAGPGAGKSELLAQKAHYLFTTGKCPFPRRILAISFKRDAARNLRDRVQERCPNYARRFESRTLDSFAKLLIDRFGQGLAEPWRPRRDYEVGNAFSSRAAEDWLLAHQVPRNSGLMNNPQFTLAVLAHGAPLPLNMLPKWPEATQLAKILWEEILQRPPNVPSLTFPMLNRLAAFLLRSNPKVLAALRMTYSYVFLDEFQDTTDSQYDLITTAFLGSSSKITAVGDSKQRIMLWAGAMDESFEIFQRDFSPKTIYLKNNYRSAPELVDMQNSIAYALDNKSFVCKSMKSGTSGGCKILEFSSEEDEAAYLSQYISQEVSSGNHKFRDFCVLTRQLTAKMITNIQRELDTRYDIKIRDEGIIQDLIAEPIISLLVSIFFLKIKRRSPTDYLFVQRELLSIWGDDDFKAGFDLGRDFLDKIPSCTEMNAENFDQTLEVTLQLIGKDAIKAKYRQYARGTFLDNTVQSFSTILKESINTGSSVEEAFEEFVGEEIIPAMTIHKSKGLEFKTVIFLGLEDAQWWNFRMQAEEEKRAFFVAFSRAIENVIFTYSDVREGRRGRERQSKNHTDALYQILLAAEVPVTDMRA